MLNAGFLLGVAMAPVLLRLLVSPPWTLDETDAGFAVRDNHGQALADTRYEAAAKPARRCKIR